MGVQLIFKSLTIFNAQTESDFMDVSNNGIDCNKHFTWKRDGKHALTQPQFLKRTSEDEDETDHGFEETVFLDL